jgi:hypothetical protein
MLMIDLETSSCITKLRPAELVTTSFRKLDGIRDPCNVFWSESHVMRMEAE